jgi:hypothetical protein
MQTALTYLPRKPIIGVYEQILIMYSIDKNIIFTRCKLKYFPIVNKQFLIDHIYLILKKLKFTDEMM